MKHDTKLAKEKYFSSLSQSLITAITISLVAAAIFFGYQTYHKTKEMAIAQFDQQQLILARSAAKGIETLIIKVSDSLRTLSRSATVQEMQPGTLEEMKNLYMQFPVGTSTRRLDKDGILRFIYPNEGWRKALLGHNYSNASYFHKAETAGRLIISHMITNEVGEKRIFLVKPIYVTDEKGKTEFNGIILASLDVDVIYRLYIAPIVLARSGYAWLLDADGTFLAHPMKEFVGQNAFDARAKKNPNISYEAIDQIQRKMIAGKEGVGRYVTGWTRGRTGTIRKVIAYAPAHVGDHVWSVAVCTPVDEVEQLVSTPHHVELYTLGFVVLALLGGGISLFLTSLRWARHLEWEVEKRTKELQKSEAQLRGVLDASDEIIFVKDLNGRYTLANAVFSQKFKRPLKEILGKTYSKLFPREEVEKLREVDRKVLEKGEPDTREETLTVGGEKRIFKVTKVPLRNGAGKITGLCGFSNDITERVQAENELRNSFVQLAETVSRAMESHDPYTAGHQRRVAELARAIGKKMGLDKERLMGLYIGGLLHDIGKISIPEEILTYPGRLTEAEWAIIRTHPRRGYEILKNTRFPWPVAEVALQHHERLDGSGYPTGLKDDEIILEARILAVADVVEAMSSHRPYRPTRGIDKALAEIKKNKGRLYDPAVVDACVAVFAEGFAFS